MRREEHIAMRVDKQLIVLTHLSQLITLVIGFGSLITPLILWATNKDRVYEMDAHGKSILNFQISILIYFLLCIPMILFVGLGLIGMIFLGIISIVFPIINAVKASNGEQPHYPFSIQFLK